MMVSQVGAKANNSSNCGQKDGDGFYWSSLFNYGGGEGPSWSSLGDGGGWETYSVDDDDAWGNKPNPGAS